MSVRNLSSTNFVTEDDVDEPPGLCADDSEDEDDLTDTSSATTPPPKPHVFALKSIIPPNCAISFPPVETLIPIFPSHNDDNTPSPYEYSDLDTSEPDIIFGPSATNLASALKKSDNPLNLGHNSKPLTYKTGLQGPNVASWIAANSTEFRRLILYPIMPDKLLADRKFDVTYYNPTTKEKIINGARTFRVRGVAGGDRINYTVVVSLSTASLQLVKTLLHSVVSDNAECMTIDIDDFFLLSTLVLNIIVYQSLLCLMTFVKNLSLISIFTMGLS